MNVTSFNINITSEQPERLVAFYRDVVGLPLNERGDGFSVAGAEILIDGHSETKGQAKDPQRILVNMFVEDVAAEQARLEAQGVEFIRKQGREYWGGIISTFLDPDGNYAQILEYRPG
jgi:predicted enzyme related to lactoylglutathione lyase